jgi:hypothetical protein
LIFSRCFADVYNGLEAIVISSTSLNGFAESGIGLNDLVASFLAMLGQAPDRLPIPEAAMFEDAHLDELLACTDDWLFLLHRKTCALLLSHGCSSFQVAV